MASSRSVFVEIIALMILNGALYVVSPNFLDLLVGVGIVDLT